MRDLATIAELIGDEFKLLNGLPDYITIEQKDPTNEIFKWEEKIESLLEICSEWKLKRIGASLIRTSVNFEHLSKFLLLNGFEHYSSRVEVYKDLENFDGAKLPFDWKSLDDPSLSEDQFKEYWKRCMLYSDNHPTTLTMEEHLDSIKSELGEGWQKSCIIFYKNNKPLGITIPHLEPGTEDEGRLFYFGILPEERGKGQSLLLHLQSLLFLKEMGATYYIGSTHVTNEKMQKVFEKSGCAIKSYTESYYNYIKARHT
ncbi:GNAT family N-acetyltransferase [Neobacillus sp. PS3-40]|uniref:GNAT family N-acetyltransferase n=1 Tax=Neobacillus sp. PS3-40 TaxID=3070679 RepID=UPI0027E19BF4|nr:GNAT family N-acetyltransferase [Neobacillus sp. PS3-40]WML42778.1 GNAT family N-acetyltransferase [Neobacillus sp. PS3-40]